jgi:Zn-dependent protease with chaperone function
MSAWLGFALECTAIAALLGAATSVVVAVLAGALRPLLREAAPSLRGDVAFVGGVLPAVVAIAGTAAAAWPPIGSALGLLPDHCLQHDHHLHVCIIHRAAQHSSLLALGAIALAAWALRASLLLRTQLRSRRDALELERLGTTSGAPFPVIEIPGSPRLCHAVGSFRRRILLSESLATQLEPVELRCALAHETAHLNRHDPLAGLVMSSAGLFALPFCLGALQRDYRVAAEQACDDAAACVVGNGVLVAEALVSVARLQRSGAAPRFATEAFGFGQHPLEARVRRLLRASGFQQRRALALPLAAGIACGACALALQQASSVHHAVETALHLLF